MKNILFALIRLMHFVCTKKVRGTILDNNNQPIPGATINVPEIHKETISDAREISNLLIYHPENFKLFFLHRIRISKSILIPKSTDLNIVLQESVSNG
jgi:hypothetical protein